MDTCWPATVKCAVRVVVVVFALTVKLTLWLPDPAAGVAFNQSASLSNVHTHPLNVETTMFPEPPLAGK